eukprot:TRINITY_DN7853_c0_g1_i3.p1 TRINITY_DN7853_c0_g1~~TRINITY_DN7853_c0_g1_i3.p1  ORF type:complete len:129 (-),score=27.27 TRINITY_DN7853_c0_g1_i3:195-581(-)
MGPADKDETPSAELSELELSCMSNLWEKMPPFVHEIVMDRVAEGLPQLCEKAFGKTQLHELDPECLASFAKQVCKMCEELVHENLLSNEAATMMNDRCKQWLSKRVAQLICDEVSKLISNLQLQAASN